MPDSLRTLIQNKIRDTIKAGPFYPVLYDANGDASRGATTISPASVIVNEITSTFDESPNRRALSLRRTGWTFHAFVGFNQEAVLELFEQGVLEDPPVVPKDEANGIAHQATLLWSQAEYLHPTQEEGSESAIRYVIEARLSRR